MRAAAALSPLAMVLACCMVIALPAMAHAAAAPPLPGHATGGEERSESLYSSGNLFLPPPPDSHRACAAEGPADRGGGLAEDRAIREATAGEAGTGRAHGNPGFPSGDLERHSEAPRMPLLHPTSLTISHYPVVGEEANVTLTVTFSASAHALFNGDGGSSLPLANPLIANITSKYHVFDMVSNIGSDDPQVFIPYDQNAPATVVAKDGATYVVQAKLVIIRDAFAVVEGFGFDGDRVSISIAAAGNQSMPYDEYARTGQTYLDYIIRDAPAADRQVASPPEVAGPPDSNDRAAGAGSAAGQQQSVPLFEIRGTLRADAYDSGTGHINVHGMEVCAYDYNRSNGIYKKLSNSSGMPACAFTDSDGRYRVPSIRNEDPDDNTRVDLAIRANSTGPGALTVHDTGNNTYIENLYRSNNFRGSYVDGTYYLNTVNSGAARIISTIMDGRDLFKKHGVDYSKLTVKWEHGSLASAFRDNQGAGPAYNTGKDVIWLDGIAGKGVIHDNSQQKWVVLHELGHHIADITDRSSAGSCGRHDIHLSIRPACAWSEGWADFVPHMVTNASVLKYGSYSIDIERDKVDYSDGRPHVDFTRHINGIPVGHRVEGQVAAALWDIKDGNVDAARDNAGGGRDDLALGDDEIMRVFNAEQYDTFEEFYDQWEAYYPSHSSRNIMILHAMGFANSLNEMFDTTSRWIQKPASSWTVGPPPGAVQPLGRPASNSVANASDCRVECTLTLKAGVDLATYELPTLTLRRYVGSNLDPGDYLRVDTSVDGGLVWQTAFLWRGTNAPGGTAGLDDGAWHTETLDLSAYLSSHGFKVRIAAKSGHAEHVAVDDVAIGGRPAGTGDRLVVKTFNVTAPRGETSTWYVRAYDERGGAVNMSAAGGPGFARFASVAPGIASVSASPSHAEPMASHTMTITAAAGGRTVSAPLAMGVAPSRLVSGAFLSDHFRPSLDGWSYEQRPDPARSSGRCGEANRDAYSLVRWYLYGGAALLSPAHQNCWYGSAGAAKNFTWPAGAAQDDLQIHAKARSISTWAYDNRLYLTVTDSRENVLTTGTVYPSAGSWSLHDSGLVAWTSEKIGWTESCPCKMYVHIVDRRNGQHHQFYLDEIHVGPAPQSSCGLGLAKSSLNFGAADAATRLSGIDTQTLMGSGTVPVISVRLAPEPWRLSSGGTYPAGITEIRAPHAGLWSWTPLSSSINLGPISPGETLEVEHRINYGSRPLVDPGSMRQAVSYVASCSGSLSSSSAPAVEPPSGSISLESVLHAGAAPPGGHDVRPRPVYASMDMAGADPRALPNSTAVPNTLKYGELLAMLSSNFSRVLISEKLAYERDIVVDWDDHPDAGPYKVIIRPDDSSQGGGMADASVTDSVYRFTGLEPSTPYVIRVGIRGNDTTQSTVRATTLTAGGASLPSGLELAASLVPNSGAISLEWADTNGVGSGRYGAVLSVGGTPFGPAGVGPGPETSAEQAVRPDWLGKTVSYKVFERLGPQRLYSNEASVDLPSALEAPRNLKASAAQGAAILVEWDHAPLFRHYILEARGDGGSWERLSRTQDNSFEHRPDGPLGQFEYRVSSQLHSVMSPPSAVLVHNLSLSGGAGGGP